MYSYPILKAIHIFDTQARLARACGVSQAAVSKWAKGGVITLDNALDVDFATGGAVPAETLCPEVFARLHGAPLAVEVVTAVPAVGVAADRRRSRGRRSADAGYVG